MERTNMKSSSISRFLYSSQLKYELLLMLTRRSRAIYAHVLSFFTLFPDKS